MYAEVQWVDGKGDYHNDGIELPTSLDRVLHLIERQGGKVSKYNRIPTSDRDTMTPQITTTLSGGE